MRDKEFISLIDKQIFKSNDIKYNKTELILYDNIDPLNTDFENYNINILNQLLALNITTQSTIEDIEKLNDKYIYLGYLSLIHI